MQRTKNKRVLQTAPLKGIKMKYTISKIIISIFVATLSFPVVAEKCNEPSPNLLDNEKEYYNLLMKDKLTRNQNIKLKELNKLLVGKWRGKAETIECVGSERNPKSKKTKSKVTAHIKRVKSQGNVVVVNGEMYVPKNKVTKIANLSLFKSDNMFNVDFSVENIFTYGERNKNKTRYGRQFLETIYSIALNDDKLNLIQNHYMNGVLISYERWTLTRK